MRDLIVRLASMKLAELKFDFEFFLYDEDIMEEKYKKKILGKYYGDLWTRKSVSLKSFKEYVLNMKKDFNKTSSSTRISNNYSFKRKALVMKLHLTNPSGLDNETIAIRLYQPREMKKGLFLTILKSSGILDKHKPEEISPFLKTAELKFDVVFEKHQSEAWEGNKMTDFSGDADIPLSKLNAGIRDVITGSKRGFKTPVKILDNVNKITKHINTKKSFVSYMIEDSESSHSPFKDKEYLIIFIRSKSIRNVKQLEKILTAGLKLDKLSISPTNNDVSQFDEGPWKPHF